MPGPERLQLADRVFRLLINSKPTLMASVVDKRVLHTRYETPHSPHTYGMRATLERFNRDLASRNDTGRIVIDSAGFRFDSQTGPSLRGSGSTEPAYQVPHTQR